MRYPIAALATCLVASTPLGAAPVACDAGTIDFDSRSYDPAAIVTTFNVGQLVQLNALPVGITPSAYDWVIEGPHIKDYDERVGTTSTGAISWSTTALAPADLAASSVSFYWRPSPSQIHPLNGGPLTRTVTLNVTVGASGCTVTQTFTVERNNTSTFRVAEYFYSANHRAPTETDLTKGRVLDDHIEWHTVFASRILEFLPWHREFIARFNAWRSEFGYPPTITWYPGNAIPTGIGIDYSPRGGFFDPNSNHIPVRFTLAGGAGFAPKRLADFATLSDFSNNLEGSWHGAVHCNVGGIMCTFQSPRDPLFYRWHGMIDRLYENFCSVKALGCAGTPMPTSDLWMADNAADIAANGAEPSSGAMWMSPSIWNRTSPATCTPPDAVATVARTCGSDADHENPIEGVTNYLYARIRNDRPGAIEIKYAEVAAYIANADTGLIWPTSYGGDPDGALPETRRFVTVNLQPGAVTDVGPMTWIPPSPVPTDHWCMYARALSEQAPITGEVSPAVVLFNALASNNVVYRNLQIVVNSTDSATFRVTNTEKRTAKVTIRIEVPDAFLSTGRVRLLVPPATAAKWRAANLAGIKDDGPQVRSTGAMRELETAVPAMEAAPKGESSRERELLRRVAGLRASVRSCVRNGRPLIQGTSRAAISDVGRIDAKREKELLDAIKGLERQQRACTRQSSGLTAFTLTKTSASIAGLTLNPAERFPITIEFSNDSPVRADHVVNVIQETAEGKTIGGNAYVVRTGSH